MITITVIMYIKSIIYITPSGLLCIPNTTSILSIIIILIFTAMFYKFLLQYCFLLFTAVFYIFLPYNFMSFYNSIVCHFTAILYVFTAIFCLFCQQNCRYFYRQIVSFFFVSGVLNGFSPPNWIIFIGVLMSFDCCIS